MRPRVRATYLSLGPHRRLGTVAEVAAVATEASSSSSPVMGPAIADEAEAVTAEDAGVEVAKAVASPPPDHERGRPARD